MLTLCPRGEDKLDKDCCLYLEGGVELGCSFPLLELGDSTLHAGWVLRSGLGEDGQQRITSRHLWWRWG